MDGDEKITHEAATMRFVRENTNIPVPSVIAWGLSHENPLGLGAFIIMEFIEGEPLDVILRQGSGPEEAHSLRLDINDEELETIYRQIANFLLGLSAHDFPQIGSLSGNADFNSGINSRPLTLKMNEIESHGGVRVGGVLPLPFIVIWQPADTADVIGHISETFSSATSYFQYVGSKTCSICGTNLIQWMIWKMLVANISIIRYLRPLFPVSLTIIMTMAHSS